MLPRHAQRPGFESISFHASRGQPVACRARTPPGACAALVFDALAAASRARGQLRAAHYQQRCSNPVARAFDIKAQHVVLGKSTGVWIRPHPGESDFSALLHRHLDYEQPSFEWLVSRASSRSSRRVSLRAPTRQPRAQCGGQRGLQLRRQRSHRSRAAGHDLGGARRLGSSIARAGWLRSARL